ncbi:FecR domain-containing protein [Echinicola marina]|uniref:FecR family protein n=1 Tax=Echinicola marina TaxID=2859768 RepID=UPI001CF68AD4|nr:FecR family protein [Echinicola marina]UCS95439.1 FecR domain-containing protein [Echinicola marina]
MKDKNIKYQKYQVEDFLSDESFIDWVKGMDSKVDWEEVLAWFPHLQHNAKEARKIINKLNFEQEQSPERISELQRRINKKIDQSENSKKEAQIVALHDRKTHYQYKSQRSNSWAWVASVAVLIIGFIGMWIWEDTREDIPEFKEVPYVTKSTEKGQKLTTRLSDGTIVTLNSVSQIYFEEIFNDTVRMVTLKGEAFFDVAKDSRPFRVKSNGTVTTALGTSFNIKQEKERVSISLVTGKVGVNMVSNTGMKESTLLIPGEQVAVDVKDKISFVKGKFDESDVLAWKRGILSFNKSNSEEVWRELEKWYGVEIAIQGEKIKKQDWNYTGSFDNESLENVLESMAFVKGFKFEITGDQVKIY